MGPRIEARGEIDDHIHALPDLFSDELVKQICARYPSPSVAVTEGNRVGDLIAAFSNEKARKGNAKKSILSLGFARPIDRG